MPPTCPATTQPILKMLFCYTNSTHKMQFIRVASNKSYSFEKIVFPQQRILFEATPKECVEVYNGREGKQVLSKILSCQNLQVEQSQITPPTGDGDSTDRWSQ